MINNNINNDSLFFSLWRNKFIRYNIFFHLRLYKEYDKVAIESLEELKNHPYRGYITTLYYNSSEPLEMDYEDQEMDEEDDINNNSIFPFGIITLVFDESFEETGSVRLRKLPLSIKKLVFRNYYNISLFNNSPIFSLLTSLTIYNFNQVFDLAILPETLIKLKLPDYEQPIFPNSLPSNLNSLSLGGGSNLNILPETFSNSLKSLRISHIVNLIQPWCLPNSITKLELHRFNLPLKPGVLPNSLNTLKLTTYNKELVVGSIPPNLESLTMFSFNRTINESVLPNSLKKLQLPEFDKDLFHNPIPHSVEDLTMNNFNSHILHADNLPSSIKTLQLDRYHDSLLNLPSNIKKLVLNGALYKEEFFSKNLPTFIESLTLREYNSPISHFGQTATSLTELNFGEKFDCSISENSLPNTIRILNLGNSFNQPLSIGSIPSSVTHLVFGKKFNQEILCEHIPIGTKFIEFGKYFYQKSIISKLIIPSTVNTLKLKNGKMKKFIEESIDSDKSILQSIKYIIT